MKQGLDRFSNQAKLYARYRPLYPEEFYDFLFSRVKFFDRALDCATGNGQVAKKLSGKFLQVDAIDISENQIKNAFSESNISYRVSRSEKTDFPDNCFNLITVGQAIHWFDFNIFYSEINRIAKPEALLAVWGYGLLKVNPEIDKVIDKFYLEITHPYWDAERSHIDAVYTTIPFPYEQIEVPHFQMQVAWGYDHMLGFLNSWSAVQNYFKANGQNPVELIKDELLHAWGKKDEIYPALFPMFSRFGLVKK